MSQFTTVLANGINLVGGIVTDSGTARPVSGVVHINGDSNITVSEVGNTATITLNSSIVVDSMLLGNLYIHDNVIEVIEADGSGPDVDIELFGQQIALTGFTYEQAGFWYLGASKEFSVATASALTGQFVPEFGQIMIGSTAGAPKANFLTAGTGVSIEYTIPSFGSPILSISSTGTGGGYNSYETITYSGRSAETQEKTMEPKKAYIGNGIGATLEGEKVQVLFKLPDTADLTIGDTNLVISMGISGCLVQPQADQLIYFSNYPCNPKNPLFFNHLDAECVEYPSTIGPYSDTEGQSVTIQYIGTSVPRFPSGKAIFLITSLHKIWTWGNYKEGILGGGV